MAPRTLAGGVRITLRLTMSKHGRAGQARTVMEQSADTYRRLVRGVADVAATLRRPIALHDVNLTPVASSPHEGPIDASRLEMIFGRPFPRPVMAELLEREHIKQAAPEARYIDGFEGLELGRAFIPVRGSGGQAVGYVWAIDVERGWSTAKLNELSSTVSELLGSDLEDLGPSAIRGRPDLSRVAAHAAAHRTAIIEIAFPTGFHPTGLTYQHALDSFESTDIASRSSLEIATISQVRVGKHHTELVLAGSATSLDKLRIHRVMKDLIDQFCGFDPINRASGRAIVSAIRMAGDPIDPSLQTLRDALTSRTGPVGAAAIEFIEDSAVLQLLSDLREALSADGYQTPHSVAPLIADARTRVIAKTVKALLDSDVKVQETADRLFIHRGTLYNRVNQAQELTGMSLTGIDRVRIHIGLIIAELTGAL